MEEGNYTKIDRYAFLVTMNVNGTIFPGSHLWSANTKLWNTNSDTSDSNQNNVNAGSGVYMQSAVLKHNISLEILHFCFYRQKHHHKFAILQ